MTLRDAVKILEKVNFPGFKLFIGGDMHRWYMQGKFDTDDGEQFTRKWYLSNQACKSEIVHTALKLVLTAAEHEIRESFTYRGKKIFGPHYDVDVLVDICGKDKNLDYRRRPNANPIKDSA